MREVSNSVQYSKDAYSEKTLFSPVDNFTCRWSTSR